MLQAAAANGGTRRRAPGGGGGGRRRRPAADQSCGLWRFAAERGVPPMCPTAELAGARAPMRRRGPGRGPATLYHSGRPHASGVRRRLPAERAWWDVGGCGGSGPPEQQQSSAASGAPANHPAAAGRGPSLPRWGTAGGPSRRLPTIRRNPPRSTPGRDTHRRETREPTVRKKKSSRM